MKHYLLAFILLCHSIVATAQQYQYVPMPLGDGQWRYRFTTETGKNNPPAVDVTIDDYMLIGSGMDTIIGGKTYKKIHYRGHHETGKKPFNFPLQHVVADNPEYTQLCLREDNKRVYWHTDYHDTMLFNFEAGIGDTIPYHYMHLSNVDKYKVYHIDTIKVDNKPRKRFWASELYYNTDTVAVIEGIGFQSGGLMMPSRNGNVGYYLHIPSFYCFTAPGSGMFPDTGTGCYYVWPYGTPTAVSSIKTSESSIKAYPNPFAGEITIQGSIHGNAAIYNSAGIKVYTAEVSGAGHKIPTTSFSTGMYMLVVTDKNGNVVHKEKMVK